MLDELVSKQKRSPKQTSRIEFLRPHFQSNKTHLFRTIINTGDLVIAVHEENILRFEIGVRQFVVVKKQHTVDELV